MAPDDKSSRCDGVEWHRVEDGCVVFVPASDEVHFLNETAMFVLESCDGATSVAEMQREFDEAGGDSDLAAGILAQFAASGIVTSKAAGQG